MVALNVVYQGEIVALCSSLAFLGTFSAVSLMEQYRLFTTHYSSGYYLLFIAFVAGSHGGISMWSLHYVAASSFRLNLPDGTNVPVRFNLGMMILILVVNIIIQFICMYVSSTDSCFNKSKKEIVEKFISRTKSNYTMTQIQQMGKYKLMFLICSHDMWKILFGGVFSAFGSTLTIYLTFMAMEFQGTVKYNPGLVALLAILNSAFGCNGFVTFFRILTIFPSMDSLRVGVSINSLVFLTGVSYFGLNTVTFEYDANKSVPSIHNTIDSSQLVVGIMTAAILYCTIAQVFVVSDLRAWLLRTSCQLRQADLVMDALYKENLTVRRTTPANREVVRYLRRFSLNSAHTTGTASTEDNTESAQFLPHMPLYNDFSDDEENSEGKRSNSSNSNHHSTNNNDVVGTVSSDNLRIKPSSSNVDIINVRSNAQVACDINIYNTTENNIAEMPV